MKEFIADRDLMQIIDVTTTGSDPGCTTTGSDPGWKHQQFYPQCKKY